MDEHYKTLKISAPKFDNKNLIEGYAKMLIGMCMNPYVQDGKSPSHHDTRIRKMEDKVSGPNLGLGQFWFDSDVPGRDIVEIIKIQPYHFDY